VSTNSSRPVTCVTCTSIESDYLTGTACACVDSCVLRNRPEQSIVVGAFAHNTVACSVLLLAARTSCAGYVAQGLLNTVFVSA
jgi:hypothetical protein